MSEKQLATIPIPDPALGPVQEAIQAIPDYRAKLREGIGRAVDELAILADLNDLKSAAKRALHANSRRMAKRKLRRNRERIDRAEALTARELQLNRDLTTSLGESSRRCR